MKKTINFGSAIVLILAGLAGYIYSVWAYPRIFQMSVELENKSNVAVNDQILIKFSEPVMSETVEKSFRIEPLAEVSFIWKNSNREVLIYPKEKWRVETDYKIWIEKGRSIMLNSFQSQLEFATEAYPRILSYFPEHESKDVILDIEDPISFTFDKLIEDYDFKLEIEPLESIVFEKKSKELKLLSKTGFKKGQRYTVSIFIRYEEEEYRKLLESSFETRAEAPKELDADFSIRLEQAKKFTEPKYSDRKYIDINLKDQVMVIFENGKPLDAFLISSGKRGMDTPIGETRIFNKHPRAWSKRYGLYMPFWMAIRGDGFFGIHELPEWPGGYKEGANHLGTPVSHGCVRLGVGAADKVYNWAEIGTLVWIY